MQSPRWPLFLGRKGCPPAVPPFLAVVSSDAATAIRSAPLLLDRRALRLRMVIEAGPEEGGEPRYDVPLSFREGQRRYGLRYVKTEWLDVTDREAEQRQEAGA